MAMSEAQARVLLEQYGQSHVFRFWNDLSVSGQEKLLKEIENVNFPLMQRLIDKWVMNQPAPEVFGHITPVPVIPKADLSRVDAQEALEAGEAALRAGRVGLFLVAGGQGTRLGFEGPKGAYPIGPLSGRSIFAFHAEKILNLQRRYGCSLPWYIMVSDTNDEETRAFFKAHAFFGLAAENVKFFRQQMIPCVSEQGKFLLERPDQLAMNPNGHGGCLPAMVDNGITQDARERGVDTLSYFQVDNWAVKVADPVFIGYHVLRNAEMSSKSHRKSFPREAVGVHCLCDGEYRVIEYSELDIYPQLLDVDRDGQVVCFAGNPAIHILSVDFVERISSEFDSFPWHRAHKKIPFINPRGDLVEPSRPNGYKFETFVFDALRFIHHAPVALEITPPGEYTPIKQYKGDNSVVGAWNAMNEYWAEWLEAIGRSAPRDAEGKVAIRIEISPQFALTREEFVEKAAGNTWPLEGDFGIGPNGEWLEPAL